MTSTDAPTRASGWTAVAVILGIVTTLVVGAGLWLVWASSTAFGFTQSVPAASVEIGVLLALPAVATLIAWSLAGGERPGLGTAIAALLVVAALSWAVSQCLTAGMAAYDAHLHDAIPGPSGWG